MPLPTYDELCDAGLICPGHPSTHHLQIHNRPELHTDPPPPTIQVTITVEEGVVNKHGSHYQPENSPPGSSTLTKILQASPSKQPKPCYLSNG